MMLRSILLLAMIALTSADRAMAQQTKTQESAFHPRSFDDVFKEARRQDADLLSPTLFEEAAATYQDAVRLLEKKKKPEKAREMLTRVEDELRVATRNAEVGKIEFASVLAARNDALGVNAPQTAQTEYELGARLLREAATSVEKGDLDAARKRTAEMEQAFRRAELTAIKASTLAGVRRLVGTAEKAGAEKYAPKTYGRARGLLEQTELLLSSNRYAGAEARARARQAEYYARFSTYVAELIKTAEDDRTLWEGLFLGVGDSVQAIAEELDFTAELDSGFAETLSTIRSVVRDTKKENRFLIDQLAERDRKVADQTRLLNDLQKTVSTLKGQTEVLAEKEAAQARALAEKEETERKIQDAESMFTISEGTVLRKKETLIIRLHGLTFSAREAQITPRQFGLLTKVQQALSLFPNCRIVVGGHTDSAGNPEANRALSDRRASAVRAYLIQQMGLDVNRISAAGFGADEPVASNDTDTGRAQNRRIDIVISLSKDVPVEGVQTESGPIAVPTEAGQNEAGSEAVPGEGVQTEPGSKDIPTAGSESDSTAKDAPAAGGQSDAGKQ